MDYGLDEELIAITSIYGPDLITRSPNSSNPILHVPHTSGVQLRLSFPADYPESKPDVDEIISAGSSTTHRWGQRVLETVRGVVERVWMPGEPVLFAVIEELGEPGVFGEGGGGDDAGNERGVDDGQGKEAGVHAGLEDSQWAAPEGPKEWFVSEAVVEKKSTFVAHAARIGSPGEAKGFAEALLASDRKFEKATHNIRAYRGKFTPEGGDRELVFQDCDDDGEDAAGGRLLHLLELTDSWNVLVVVSRWYGGIKLGPDRFRIINQVARDALVTGGFVKEESKKGARKGR